MCTQINSLPAFSSPQTRRAISSAVIRCPRPRMSSSMIWYSRLPKCTRPAAVRSSNACVSSVTSPPRQRLRGKAAASSGQRARSGDELRHRQRRQDEVIRARVARRDPEPPFAARRQQQQQRRRHARVAKPADPFRRVFAKLFSPRRGRIALSSNERIAEFLDFAIQAKFAYVNKQNAPHKGERRQWIKLTGYEAGRGSGCNRAPCDIPCAGSSSLREKRADRPAGRSRRQKPQGKQPQKGQSA